MSILNVASDGRFLRVNEAACRIFGYSADELTTKSCWDIIHPDDLAATVARLKEMHLGKIDRNAKDKRYLHKDGTLGQGDCQMRAQERWGNRQKGGGGIAQE